MDKPSDEEKRKIQEGAKVNSELASKWSMYTNPQLFGNSYLSNSYSSEDEGNGSGSDNIVGTHFDWKSGKTYNVYENASGRRYYLDMYNLGRKKITEYNYGYQFAYTRVYLGSNGGNINQRLFGEITLGIGGTAFMISESAGLSLRGLSQSDVAFKTLNGIKGGTKLLGRFAGGADVALNLYLYSQDPSWGNLAKLGVSATGTGLTFSGNPLTVTIGLGITALDLFGTFDPLYNNLNSAQNLYQISGLIFLPSLGPISPYPRVIKLK